MRKRWVWGVPVTVVLIITALCLVSFVVITHVVVGNGYLFYGVNQTGRVAVANKKMLDRIVATVRQAVPFPPWIVVIFRSSANPAIDYAVNIPSRGTGHLPIAISGCTGLRMYAARSVAVFDMDIDVKAIKDNYGTDADRLTNSVLAQCLDYAAQGGKMETSYEQVRSELFTILREGGAIKLGE